MSYPKYFILDQRIYSLCENSCACMYVYVFAPRKCIKIVNRPKEKNKKFLKKDCHKRLRNIYIKE